MDKLKSRKLIVSVIGAILIVVAPQVGLDLDTKELLALAGVIGAYVVSQGYVDGKK